MNRRMMARVLGLAALASAGALEAQGVAGTYLVEYPAQVRSTNGAEEVVALGHARLVLQVKGDSLVGTWTITDRPDAKPRGLRGTVQGNTVNFSTDPTEGHVNMNGQVSTIKMFADYTATITGDEIKGTLKQHSEDGSIQSGERAWSGKREK